MSWVMMYLGYPISEEAFSILFNRFAKRRQYMNIDDFAACLSRVKIMNGVLIIIAIKHLFYL